jgi:hypothetical protein
MWTIVRGTWKFAVTLGVSLIVIASLTAVWHLIGWR